MRDILVSVSKNRALSRALVLFSHAVTVLGVLFLLYIEYLAYKTEPIYALWLALSLAIPFGAVTLLRIIVNAPRPYELYDFYTELPRGGKGHSFPSRHAFSAFAIGVSALPLCPVPAIVMLALSVLMCVARVLVGIHFIRDVAAGAAIGVISAILGIILL